MTPDERAAVSSLAAWLLDQGVLAIVSAGGGTISVMPKPGDALGLLPNCSQWMGLPVKVVGDEA